MDTTNMIVMRIAAAAATAGHTYAQARALKSAVPFRARTRIGGDAFAGHNLAPDSAPWRQPV